MKTFRLFIWSIILFVAMIAYVWAVLHGSGSTSVVGSFFGKLFLPCIAFLIAIWKSLYPHWDRLYLLVQKAKYQLLNIDTQWSLNIELTIDQDLYIAERIKKTLLSCYQGKMKFSGDTSRLDARIERLMPVEFTFDQVPGATQIHISILDFHVTFRKSLDILKKEIVPLFDRLDRELRPHSESTKYSMKVYFKNWNPYFGLYINRLRLHSIREFNVVIDVPHEKESRVAVSKEELSISSRSLIAFQNLAESYLPLAKLGGN